MQDLISRSRVRHSVPASKNSLPAWKTKKEVVSREKEVKGVVWGKI
jgi:hypothetical protein